MTPSLITRHSSLAVALALALCAASATAQMNDPTRPPASFGSGEAEGDGGGGILLQSVLISPNQKAAIINGVLVPLGGKYGNAVLVEVAENEVVLRSGGVKQVLKLHPGVSKRELGAAAAAAPAPAQAPSAEPGSGAAPAR